MAEENIVQEEPLDEIQDKIEIDEDVTSVVSEGVLMENLEEQE
jgi:hypothetical protein